MSLVRASLIIVTYVAGVTLLSGCDVNTNTNVAPSRASSEDKSQWEQVMANSDHLIVPGRRIGPVSVGMTMDQVSRIVGQPEYTVVFEDDIEWGYGANLWVHFNENPVQTAWLVRYCDPSFRTPEGIVGGSEASSTSDVQRAYGQCDHSLATDAMVYSRLGVQFEFDSNSKKIEGIRVMAPAK